VNVFRLVTRDKIKKEICTPEENFEINVELKFFDFNS